jgi:hypothetical protein
MDTPKSDSESRDKAVLNDALFALDDAANHLLALDKLGWSVERASLYDQEGIEGWRWTDPRGKEYEEIGDWAEPPTVPEAAEIAAREWLSQANRQGSGNPWGMTTKDNQPTQNYGRRNRLSNSDRQPHWVACIRWF